MHETTKRIDWMRRLPEMGTIHATALDELGVLDIRLAALERERVALEREAEAVIARAEKECAGLWTAEEIARAKEATW